MSNSISITSVERNTLKALAKSMAKKNMQDAEITKTACKTALKDAEIKQALFEVLYEAVNKIKATQRKAASKLKLEIKVIALKVNEGEDRINFSKSLSIQALKDGGLKKSLALDLMHTVRQLEVARIKKAALAVYCNNYNCPDVGHGQVTINGVADPAFVGVSQDRNLNWKYYGGSFKNRPAQVTDTIINLPLNWMDRVVSKGIELVDGLMTLDASPLPAPLGCKLYAAKWLMQGQGYNVNVASGFIAISNDGTAYHAVSAIKAIKGLAKKSAAVARVEEWTKLFDTESIENFAEKLPANSIVSIADAKAVGACDYGIKSWCFSTGLSYNKGYAPVADVIQAYHKEPRVEARAAILFALRKLRVLAKEAA